MRLYPPAHTLVRQADAESKLCGRSIPPGRIVAMSVWGIRHNPCPLARPSPLRPRPLRRGARANRRATATPSFPSAAARTRASVGSSPWPRLLAAVATVVRDYRLRSLVDRSRSRSGTPVSGGRRRRPRPPA
ncbi:MAG: cytochrome P450, partial [Actinobacteria bacterium]|nr:cytochrome P450 [Actinomycetota bacterium]